MNANTADPVTLARNLLDSLADADETETIEAPASVLLTLATTTLDLTAKVERVEALAEECERDGVHEPYAGAPYSTFAVSIHAALKGGDR